MVLGELLVEREGLGRLVLRQRDLGAEELGALFLVDVLRRCDQAVDRLARGGRVARSPARRRRVPRAPCRGRPDRDRVPRPPASDTAMAVFVSSRAKSSRPIARASEAGSSSTGSASLLRELAIGVQVRVRVGVELGRVLEALHQEHEATLGRRDQNRGRFGDLELSNERLRLPRSRSATSPGPSRSGAPRSRRRGRGAPACGRQFPQPSLSNS